MVCRAVRWDMKQEEMFVTRDIEEEVEKEEEGEELRQKREV